MLTQSHPTSRPSHSRSGQAGKAMKQIKNKSDQPGQNKQAHAHTGTMHDRMNPCPEKKLYMHVHIYIYIYIYILCIFTPCTICTRWLCDQRHILPPPLSPFPRGAPSGPRAPSGPSGRSFSWSAHSSSQRQASRRGQRRGWGPSAWWMTRRPL